VGQNSFTFDASQQFQLDAIASVVDLFNGQPADAQSLETTLKADPTLLDGKDDVFDFDLSQEIGAIGNNLVLDDEVLLANLQMVQDRQGLEVSPQLFEGSLDFDIEMETGTGKTYVYLRTVFELAKKYNFKKFIIMVPSVAIREGVNTSIELMRAHFSSLYPGQPFDSFVFSGKNPEAVQSFATSTSVQIMVLTIDSIRGDANNRIIHQRRDRLSGLAPIDFLAATMPVVIMDEPQNMDTDLSKTALATMNPLCTLRYSATHKTKRNVVYRLDPVESHELGLVKSITVSEVAEQGADVTPYIKLVAVKSEPSWVAKVELNVRKKDGSYERKTVSVAKDRALELSDDRVTGNPAYSGIRLDTCTIGWGGAPASATFTNVGILVEGESRGGATADIFREMIRETISEHFQKQSWLASKGIKVLSLFFVDKVASYMGDGSSYGDANGDFVTWFDEAFNEIKASSPHYAALLPLEAKDVRVAYFSQVKKTGKTEFIDSSEKASKEDDSYGLIMKDKARLLDPDEPVRFIFSHSALREGWDNPNVFQICALREMGAVVERRQTIGRGLRLPVVKTENGYERVSERDVATLTVVANESYLAFAKSLQREYQDAGVSLGTVRDNEFARIYRRDDDGVMTETQFGFNWSVEVWAYLDEKGFIDKGILTPKFRPTEAEFSLHLPQKFASYEAEIIERMKNAGIERFVKPKSRRQERTLNKQLYISPEFEEFWETISQRTTYRVAFDQEKLKASIVEAIKEMPNVPPRKISVKRVGISITRAGASGQEIGAGRSSEITQPVALPDIIAELQESTSLTRATLVDVLIDSERLGEFPKNPNDFIVAIKAVISRQLATIVNDGIQYEKIQGSVYELRELQRDGLEEKERFLDQLYQVKNSEKTDFDYLVYDSGVEREFAEYLDGRADISLFMKLPSKFKIPTPVGDYNPDWAIVKKVDGEDRLYMIRETKSTDDEWLLRPSERAKISAAKKHFEAIGVDYAKASPSAWGV
jgi:type III restriction enzyme